MTTDSGAAFERAFELHRDGKLAQALAAYEALLERWPGHAGALHYSGVLLFQSGRLDAAVARIESSLKSVPASADAWCNLALVYQAQGRLEQAVAALNEALRHEPGLAQIWNNLASVLLQSGRNREAESAVRHALQLDAANLASQFNLALCLEAQGRLDEALRQTEAIARAFPEAIPPAGLKAQIEQSLGRLDAARTTLANSLARSGELPAAAALHFQLAGIEQQQGRLVEAASAFERVLKLDPGSAGAVSELLFLRKELADWHDLGLLRDRFRAAVAAGQGRVSPFCLLSDPSTRAEQRLCAQVWSSAYPVLPQPQRKPSDGILRIGYLSADFRQHATGVLVAGLFEHHDREHFRVFGYSTGADDGSALRARLIAGFDRFVDARGWTPRRLATQIAADGVDILVDLKGHTYDAPTHAVALRPAPIQVNYLGYPGTMGAPFIDYLIGDPVVTPLSHAADYSETLVQLPASYQINDAKRTLVPPPPRSELGLPEQGFIFCGFCQAYKLNPETLDAWAQILAAVPGSALWLLGGGEAAVNRSIEANLRREAVARNIDPSRVVFASRRPYAEYLGLYWHADLFLDTWPYNAHTTASDALWAGCPVLTWLGETFPGRVGASLLTAVGLPELIAPDARGYIARAIELANDAGALARYRQHLADAGRRSALFDTVATTHALEDAYARMAEQARSGARAAFRVEARSG